MHGLHLTADLTNCLCDPALETDAAVLSEHCLQLVARCGLRAVAHVTHSFGPTLHGPGGVTATILLAESHLCVHTWPEFHSVTLDVYVCNHGTDQSAKAHRLMDGLLHLFRPATVERNAMVRGMRTPDTPRNSTPTPTLAHRSMFHEPG